MNIDNVLYRKPGSVNSTGRNGMYKTHGLSIMNGYDAVEIAAIHSRGIGRAIIEIEKNPDTLTEIANALLQIAESIRMEADAANSPAVNIV